MKRAPLDIVSSPQTWGAGGGSVWWATVFAAAFGYTEAVLVVYLRKILGEASGMDYAHVFHGRGLALNTATVFADAASHGTLYPELSREVATLLLLLGAAMAMGRTAKERLAFYLWTFAVWDETYYLFLKGWTAFPQSLLDTDIYFLVPWAWYGPVWFPVLVVMPALMVVAWRLWSGKLSANEP